MITTDQNIVEINKNIVEINKSIIAINEDIVEVNEDIVEINEDIVEINDALIETNQAILTNAENIGKINETVNKHSEDIDDICEIIDEINTNIEKIGEDVDNNTKEQEKLGGRISTIEGMIENNEIGYDEIYIGEGEMPNKAVLQFILDDVKTMKIKQPDGTFVEAPIDYTSDIEAKLDKTGGTIDGSLVINQDLTVKGKTIAEEHETVVVEDNLIVLNSNKIDLQTDYSGIVINKDENSTYGAVYDPKDDTFKFGEGRVNEEEEFEFNEGEGLPFAVRDDSSKFTDGHLVEWDAEGYKFVDSGKTIKDLNYFGQGTSIPKGADLDTYTTEGKYFASSGSIAESLVNSPTVDNFVMFVFKRTTGKSINQMIITLGSRIFLRGCNSSGELRAWSEFAKTSALQELTEIVNNKAPIKHEHEIEEVNNLQETLDNKAPIKHEHEIEEVSSLQETLDTKAILGEELVNTDVAYIKDVPSSAAKYATINKIGGMTRKCTNILRVEPSNMGTKNGITATLNSDGTVTLNGTATANTTFYLITNHRIPAGEYYFKINGSGMGWSSYWGATYNVVTGSTKYDTGSGVAFTSNGEHFQFQVEVASGVSLNNRTLKPMINIGSSALDFEPYFSGLRDAKVTEVKSVGRNLFDLSKAKADKGRIEIRKDSILWEYPVSNQDLFAFQIIVDVIPNTTYSLNWKATSINRVFVYTDVLWGNNLANIQKRDSFNSGKNERLVLGFYSSNSNRTGTSEIISDIILNKGTSVLPYSPYTEHTLEIPEAVQNEEWYGIGIPNTEYYNSIDLENGKGNIKAKEIVLNGTENFLISKLTDYHYFYVPIGDVGVKPNTDLLCDQYDFANEATRDKTCFVGSGGVSIRDDRFTTANDFKTYLAEQYANGTPVTLICAMATPTTEDISNLITDDNLIGVESGGTLTFENEYGYDVPSEVEFYLNNNDVVGAKKFIGDLIGKAKNAENAELA